MMDFSKSQTSSLSEEGTSAAPAPAGVKLDLLMEQLQRQHGGKLDLSLQEKHILQAQFLFAQHAAAARAAGSPLFGKADGQTYHHQAAYTNQQGGMDVDEDDDEESEDEQEAGEQGENDDMGDEEEENGAPFQQMKHPQTQQVPGYTMNPYASPLVAPGKQQTPPTTIKQEQEEKEMSPAEQPSFTSPNGFADWSFDEQVKQRAGGIWSEDTDGGRARESSRDFAKLYELDNDPQRKEFLDELFVFMQKRGTPVNRIPIMAKQVLDLYKLYRLVTDKGGLVEVINKKIWREITRGLNLPTSITSAAFTLRTQYMKYLYAFECDKKGLSSPGELQAAIDNNRREGRRPSYTNSLYRYSPSPSSGPHALLSSPTMPPTATGNSDPNQMASPVLKRSKVSSDETPAPIMPARLPVALALSHQQQQQQQQLAQAATMEHLRERLERGSAGAADGPEKKMMRLAEEQQRLMQQALQQNLLAMASHFNPVNLKLNNGHENKQDMSLSITTNGAASISMSVEVNGTVYSGTLFAQKSAAPVVSQAVTQAGKSGFSAFSSSHSPSSSSSTSSKGPN
ncbi:AT-rich interactive domain-containing protein 3B-like [Synchiropus splendidus]|uniref:AT-rich interactive domain-containing protein 3B-like n=1 Tax=Synchiropus splendidus TaxID=270530 RepID=UPI00237E9C6E|nr:AT-rich interactive domain-containing protein 3B-like [Synchiropus splendidus]